MKDMPIGLKEALRLTLKGLRPLPAENVALLDGVDRAAAFDTYALMDSPSIDSSRKDGYAVISREVSRASPENPVRLQLLGSMAPGNEEDIQLEPGATVRVLTGARIPTGADAIVAEEFVTRKENDVMVANIAEPGRNILPRGGDVACGELIVRKGEPITPAVAGLLAAAGHDVISVFRSPVVGIIGTGDEVVETGQPLTEGKLYASNIVTLAGWCSRYNLKTALTVVRDDPGAMAAAIETFFEKADVLITSGGAWTGDRDMVAQILEGLGWQEVFHGVRMGPGKAVGYGVLHDKPVFMLAGGPHSNLMGFLQIALPGIRTLSGQSNPALRRISAGLATELKGSELDWTDFFFGTVRFDAGLPRFYPVKKGSRLRSLAEATAVASIPEGQDRLARGAVTEVQLLE